MRMECLVKRVGVTPVVLPTGGGKVPTKYLFFPHNFVEEGEPSTSICDVINEEHLNWMMKHPKTFRKYDPALIQKEVQQSKQEDKKTDMSGFAIRPHQNKGYIVVDQRDPKNLQYMDQRGQWKASTDLMEPFLSEVNAWEWLKMNRPFIEERPFVQEVEKPIETPSQEKRSPGRPPKTV